jgi:hypothetical protein
MKRKSEFDSHIEYMEQKKTSYTMDELQAKIDAAIERGDVHEYVPTKKEIEAAKALVAAADEKRPELREIYDANIEECHFCLSVEFPLEKRKAYMRYAHARENILRC